MDVQIVMTEQQREVLEKTCQGMNYIEIGEVMFKSPPTIKKVQEELMEKFGVSTLPELIKEAIKSGIVAIG